jgi:iron complex outermembrane recepter protein
MYKKKVYLFALAATASSIAFSSAAYAQQGKSSDDPESTIVVTGQKQQYMGDVPIKDLPQNVQTLSADLLSDAGITRLDDALQLASGVSRQNNFGGLWDSFAIRGFAGDENFPSGFLVNGFNAGRGYGGPVDTSNVASIEVLKGPNSALFGRGEPGGTVNIITKKANFSGQKGSFTLSGGSWSDYRVEGDFNLPVSDTLAFRVTGAVQDADSFRDTVHTNLKTVNPSMFWKLGSRTSLTYAMEYKEQKVPFDRGVVAPNGKLGIVPASRFLGSPLDGPVNVKVWGHQAQLQQDIGRDWTLLLGFGYRETSFKGYSSDPELVVGRQNLYVDGRTLSRQRRFRDYNTDNMVTRGEISGTANTGLITHHVILGADYDVFNIDLLQTRYRPTRADNRWSIDIFNPNYSIVPPIPTGVLNNSYERQKGWGVYFMDQIDLTDRLKIRGGGRYDNFDQRITDRRPGINSPTPNHYTRFSPNAGIVYEVTDSLSLYGSYGEGFRPNSGQDANSVPFQPETSRSYEVGAKFVTPGEGISSTLSLFTMKKTNILTQDPANPNFSKAIGAARSKGIEFSVIAKLPSDALLNLSYSYIDAGWAQDVNDPNFGQPIKTGDPLINIPKNQLSALLTKDFAVGNHDAMLGAGVLYVDKRLGETATSFFLPSYTLVKLIGSFDVTEAVRLSADVNNLFNTTYYASSYATLWVQPGTPRSFHVRATFTF